MRGIVSATTTVGQFSFSPSLPLSLSFSSPFPLNLENGGPRDRKNITSQRRIWHIIRLSGNYMRKIAIFYAILVLIFKMLRIFFISRVVLVEILIKSPNIRSNFLLFLEFRYIFIQHTWNQFLKCVLKCFHNNIIFLCLMLNTILLYSILYIVHYIIIYTYKL